MEAGEFGEKMNSMPKYVASRTLETASWNATIITGDVADAVRHLKQDDGGAPHACGASSTRLATATSRIRRLR